MLTALLALASTIAATPAADTTRYVVLNHGRPAGEMIVAEAGDSVVVQYAHIDRNRGQWLENRYRFRDGALVAAESRPLTRDGQPAGRGDGFELAADSVRWRRGDATGSDPMNGSTFARLSAATPHEQARLVAYLLSRPDRSADLVPGGRATVEIEADTVVPTDAGPRRVRMAVVSGPGGARNPIWIAADGRLFATNAGWFITVAPGAEPALPVLRAVERAWHEARAADIARELMKPADAPVVIRNGDVFDAATGELRPNTTVVVRGDRIVAVGPAGSVTEPADAVVIDATGKTVMPGLRDMHTHLQFSSQTSAALLQLAAGITTIRDLASDLDAAVSQRDRADAGTIVSPRLILGGFIEGPGQWAGPSEVIVRAEAEARAWVARYDSLGYRQIKLYNLVHPDLVPVIAAEAHARGMRLSGHVPRGLSVEAAVKLGFDEINHAAFLFSTFFQDSLYVPTMRPYSGVAAIVAPGFDVESDAMTRLIGVLREHGTVIDGTFNIWQGGAGALRGEGGPAAAAYGALIKRLYDAGVTLVPGTDNFTSSTLITELELYEHAGIPAPQVLRIATLGSAEVMGEAEAHGSIEVGKVADLIVVDGRPSERIADLRRVQQVMRAGRLYTPEQLREAARR